MIELFSNPWANAGVTYGIIVIACVFILFLAKTVVLRFTSKTKTQLDDLIVKKLRMPLFLVGIFFGLKITLNTFGLLTQWQSAVDIILDSILYIIIIIGAIELVNLIFNFWAKKWTAKTKSKADDQVVAFLHKVIAIALWIIGALLILQVWGVQVGPLLASLGIAGIALAFALQNTLGNIFGGVSLILDKNISEGDIIDVDGSNTLKGKVIDIGLRSTKVQTFDRETLIVPNGKLSDSMIINVNQPSPKVRLNISFGVAYGSDIEKIKAMVMKEILKIEGLDKDKEPIIRFSEMGPSSLNFNAYIYLESYTDRAVAKDLANTLIYNVLNKNNIEIPYPQMDIHMKK